MRKKAYRKGEADAKLSNKRRVVIAIILLSSLMTAGILAQQASRRHKTEKNRQTENGALAPASLTPNSPSKEYIYAGGRLVATEQPSTSGGNGGGLVKLTGVAFGTSPAFAPGSEYDKAHDGNIATIFDYISENGGYTGIDLGAGNGKKITKIRYYARDNWATRMLGGKFQGSNTSSSTGYIDLHTIAVTPPQGNWVEVTITDATAYRYVRYLSPDGGYCNLAEVEFYSNSTGSGTLLAGTKFGTGPAYQPGREFDKAYDGNTSTYDDDISANGAYTGIDFGAGNAKAIIKIRYYPRTDTGLGPGRMVGGKFQGSNTSQTSGYSDLHIITTTPPNGWVEVTISDPTAYRYLRYLSPDGGYCNVAEIEFYGN